MPKTFVELMEEFSKQKLERIEYLLRTAKAWVDVSDLPNKKENWDKKDKGEDKAMEIINELMGTIEEVAILTQGLDIYRVARERGIDVPIPEIDVDDEQYNDNEEEFHADGP